MLNVKINETEYQFENYADFINMAFVEKRGLYLNNHGKIIHKDFTKVCAPYPAI